MFRCLHGYILLALGTIVGLLLAPRDAHAAAPSSCSYEVKQGDTLGHIALRHGLSASELMRMNPDLRAHPDQLGLGQRLTVCTASEPRSPRGSTKKPCGKGGHMVSYAVVQGDTLAGIAERHDVSEQAIKQFNRAVARAPDKLSLGQQLQICIEPIGISERSLQQSSKKAKECGFETPLFRHEVVPGEHLGQIAGRYGVRRRDLQRLNPALRADPDRLRVGQVIRVCPEISPRERRRITHVVRSGENIGKIAVSYGLSPQELIRYQQGRLTDPNALREGHKLQVWLDGSIVAGFGSRDTDTGSLRNGTQLPPGRHYVIKWQASAWGTTKTVRAIQRAVSHYRQRVGGGPKVHIGDISKRGGGRFPPHISHQHGRDVDIGYVLRGKDAHEVKFRGANNRNLDVPRTWALVKSFIDTDEVTYIFMDYRIQQLLYDYAVSTGVDEGTLEELFQYPRGRGRSHGLIRHWRGHSNHFHVRFRP